MMAAWKSMLEGQIVGGLSLDKFSRRPGNGSLHSIGRRPVVVYVQGALLLTFANIDSRKTFCVYTDRWPPSLRACGIDQLNTVVCIAFLPRYGDETVLRSLKIFESAFTHK